MFFAWIPLLLRPPPRRLSLTHLTSPHLTSPHLTSSHLISSHLISSHLISSHLISLIIHRSSLHHLSHLTHHSPLYTSPLITSHSSFTTDSTHHHLSHLTHHSPLYTSPLITSHSPFTTLHISLITSHSSFTTLHYTTSHYISCQASCSDECLPFAWQAQCTEPPGGAAARVGATGAAAAFVWQAQYTEPLGGAAARVGAAGAAAAFCVAGAVHRASWTRGRRWGRGCLLCGRRSAQSLWDHFSLTISHLTHHLSHLTHHAPLAALPTYHISLITSHFPHLTHHFSLTTSHSSLLTFYLTSHSPLITSHSSCTTRSNPHLSHLTHHFSLPTSHSSLLPFLCHISLTYHSFTSHTLVITPSLLTHHLSHLTHHSPLITTPLLTTSHYGSLSCGRRSTQSLLVELRFVWQAQCREPSGGAGARVGAAGAAAFCVAGAVHRASWRSCGARRRRWGRDCLLCGRRSTQSLLEELRRVWAPLGAAAALCVAGAVHRAFYRGAAARVASAGAAAAFCVAGAVHRASWRSCGARGRCWAAAAFCVAVRQSLLDELRRDHLSHHFVTHHLSHTIFDTPSCTHHL